MTKPLRLFSAVNPTTHTAWSALRFNDEKSRRGALECRGTSVTNPRPSFLHWRIVKHVGDRTAMLEKFFFNHEVTKSNIILIGLPQIVVAVVACGDRLAEALVMIKSAIVFTRSPLKFIVLADDFLIPSFMEKWACRLNVKLLITRIVGMQTKCQAPHHTYQWACGLNVKLLITCISGHAD
uniref:Uncharacterized protein n=1 Tax=Timema genevievae TaxID=629358 RepID=A0A7R9K753_TIMGE|nr:unnamed protein product [Timema genevievae]